MKKYIVIKTSFEAIHCWPECPYESVSFLKNKHRHKFYVKMKWVIEIDRQKEFFVCKKEVDEYININYHQRDLGSLSCEEIALILLEGFDADFVSVSEDNENGAEVFS